ncbi:DUF4160 domain-containing protein [Leptospira santarosai]|uniref:PF13711 domain protein n=1 Tax=Leptospira santarosai TaxID=28183 RepID=A0A2P1QSS7_9LEPT|nr:DUF4160 domain-containing protein [Leptospira santarosai]ASV11703.1 DUF4160 domain-containing protein [Leptospira santarosai]AVQ11943.1 PF13711 domain protein [Leptospira santarosai]MBW9233859.1 DUF4160 domain-containing protein [Leptospira santarosai]OLY58706.1 hypothetical protein BV917_20100 [Leptospira santarosai serovar Guaricura]
MPLISEFYGIKIYINYLDHNPPHIHVYYAEHSALVSIAELKILEGHLPKVAKKLVLEWMFKNRKALQKNWDRATKREAIQKIKPLE